jgi:hypothetical protein
VNPTPDIPAGQNSSVLQSKTMGKIISPRRQSLEIATEDFMRILYVINGKRINHGEYV